MRLPTRLLHRKNNSHKGDYGRVLILAGSLRFSGAGLLCSEAALRSGAGLVTLGVPSGIAQAVIRKKVKEVMLLPLGKGVWPRIKAAAEDNDVLVVGPGLDTAVATRILVRRILKNIDRPMVIDADGLNAIAGVLPSLALKSKNLVFTPHPGEMARLTGLPVRKIEQNRVALARNFSRRYKLTLVLKGHRTVVAASDGRVYLNKTGNPGMATAGSGDVLSGMIAAFLGQGLEPFAAAKYAVYLHGLAGDLAAREKTEISLIASDIIGKIPAAIKRSS